MRTRINNRIYDTDTATNVSVMIEVQSNCNLVRVRVYKKRNGEYFLHCVSNSNTYHHIYNFLTDSAYNDPANHRWVNGSFIIPLSEQADIDYWLEKAESEKEYLDHLFSSQRKRNNPVIQEIISKVY